MPLEHPEIGWIERTGYPSWIQDDDFSEEFDEDRAYEERRDSVFDGLSEEVL